MGGSTVEMSNRLFKLFSSKRKGSFKKFLHEIKFLIEMYLQNGPEIDLQYVNGNTKKFFENLTAKYAVAPYVNGTDITLRSIADSFPKIVLEIMMRTPHIHRPVPVQVMEARGFIGFRPELRTAAWFHVIPACTAYIGLFKAILIYEFQEEKRANFGNKKYNSIPNYAHMNRHLEIGRAAFESQYFTESSKHIMTSFIPVELMEKWSRSFDRLFPDHTDEVFEIFEPNLYLSDDPDDNPQYKEFSSKIYENEIQ